MGHTECSINTVAQLFAYIYSKDAKIFFLLHLLKRVKL